LLIEASKPLRVRWPEGEIRLEPGKPVHLPREQAQKLLNKVPDKVRFISPDWLQAWRDLATLTDGITRDDHRFQPVMSGLDQCDLAFEQGDWPAFERAAARVKLVVMGAR
jgi:hypothetical protein